MQTTTYPKHKDDRTEDQKKTHTVLIGGTDSFLSGWGHAQGRNSFAFWACEPKYADSVWSWVKRRGDIKRIRQVSSNYRTSSDALVHIYVVTPGHPAIEVTP